MKEIWFMPISFIIGGMIMNRCFIVEKESLLFQYLKEKLTNLSKNNVKSLFRRKMVSVNDNIVTEYHYHLNINDVVTIKNNVVESSFFADIKIIYEDKFILVVDKPSGILSIATEKNKDSDANLYSILSRYVKSQNSNCKIFIVHRLDKDTSGVILFAKSEKVKKILQENWNASVNRIYYAVVIGHTKDADTLVSYLEEDKNLMTYSSSHGKLAITHYERIKENSQFSLLKIKIDTGRRNQIRVQLRDIKHPILGDTKYGNKDKIVKRLMLHASILDIIHPITREKIRFESRLPEIFDKVMGNKGVKNFCR